MAEENDDIAWTQWAFCGAALLAGLAVGTFVIAPMWEKSKEQKDKDKASK